jgi:acetyl esterase/lipase
MAILSLGLVLFPGLAAMTMGQDSTTGAEVRTDVVYGHKDGMALTYDVFTPKSNAKGVGLLFMVSGGWVSTWAPPAQTSGIFRPMLDRGYTVIAIRHGSSPRYLVPDAVADVKLALQHVSDHAADYQIDPNKLGVFGFSAGGHLSLILGTQTNHLETSNGKKPPHVAAVAAVFPPTDLAPYVDPSSPRREEFPALRFDPKQSDSVSPIKHVTSDDAPTILIHGDKDDLVPVSHSQDIKKVFDEKNVTNELMVVPGAGHGFNGQQQKEVYKAMLDWFDAKLK